MISFVVAGDPVPWERTEGNGKRRFTAARTRRQKQLVAAAARIAGAVPLDGSARLTVHAFRATRRRCDWDNLGKLVSDALNGVCWHDDSQVDDARVLKSIDPERPRTEVIVEPLSQPDARARQLRSILGPRPLERLNRRRLQPSVRRPA